MSLGYVSSRNRGVIYLVVTTTFTAMLLSRLSRLDGLTVCGQARNMNVKSPVRQSPIGLSLSRKREDGPQRRMPSQNVGIRQIVPQRLGLI